MTLDTPKDNVGLTVEHNIKEWEIGSSEHRHYSAAKRHFSKNQITLNTLLKLTMAQTLLDVQVGETC